ncbi:MAG TPA: hypothetical protein VK919_03325 [Solirubrobacterales bacterium]|nr:hypothetical protein [Solirubrobacterales bacterium]
MEFFLVSLGIVAAILLFVLVVARAYPGSGADLLDWRPSRSPEFEAELETHDVQQMIDAQNELRRRRGASEITEADAHRMAREDEAVRERGRRSPRRDGEGEGGERPGATSG